MSLFDINFDKLARAVTPEQIWGRILKLFLLAFVSPITSLYNLFRGNRDSNLYRLSHNSQIVKMEAVLNDAFDNALRRIVIVDGPIKEAPAVYLRAELKPLYIRKSTEATHKYTYTAAETAVQGLDFIVQVPIVFF